MSPLQRLYKTKFALLAVVSAVLGMALLLVAHVAGPSGTSSWLTALPLAEVGGGLFTAGLFGVLFYGGCGIRHVNTSDYIASAKPVLISQTPADEPTPSVELSFDGWVFPKAGVAFVWVLDDEMGGQAGASSLRRVAR